MKIFVKNQLTYWFPVYIWAALIFYFSAMPLPSPGISYAGRTLIVFSDQYKHILVYGFLTFLSWRAFYNSNFKYSRIFAIAVVAIYGAGNELYQYFVPGRSASLIDAGFNLIGCILIQPLIMLYSKKFSKK
ncbi:MAG: VanZ family protein [Nanoarchaeota archaeon]|nr:VanZ family protein [Nanoarchaeota archaeon]